MLTHGRCGKILEVFPVPLRPWIGEEPVRVRPDIPTDSYEQKRIVLSDSNGTWSLGVVRYMGPPTGYYWVVDSVQVEYACAIDDGTRDIYVYAKDKVNNAMRQRIARMAKSEIMWMTSTYGCGYNGRDASSGTGSFDMYLPVVAYPAQIGAGVFTFRAAGDVFNMAAFVREYKVV